MSIVDQCSTTCDVRLQAQNHMPPEPAEYCDGDPVPHSDRCRQHGGEDDFEAFMEQWPAWVGEDGPCECVLGSIAGTGLAELDTTLHAAITEIGVLQSAALRVGQNAQVNPGGAARAMYSAVDDIITAARRAQSVLNEINDRYTNDVERQAA